MTLGEWLGDLASDARHAARTLRANPGFATAVVVSLALAVGASSSAFSVVDAIRFRALPFPDAKRLVLISEVPEATPNSPNACRSACSVAFTTFQNTVTRARFRTMDLVAAHVSGAKALMVNGESETVVGSLVSDSIFALLHVTPARGRLFVSDDHRLGATPVTILSHELWTTRFGSDPAVIGAPVQLSDTKYTVVGIMPPGFDFESGARFWLPAMPSLDPSTRPSIRSVTVVGRLAPGATVEQARAELEALEMPQAARSGEALQLTAAPLRVRYAEASRNNDLIFFAVVAAVVLIACVNLTNLLLTRGLDQRREFAVRSALGAGSLRLARPILVQNSLLAAAGTAGGLVAARVFIGVVRSVSALDTFRPTGMDYRIDWRVAAFASVVALLAAAVMSVLPVRLVLAASAQDALREHSSFAPGGEAGTRIQRAFVVAQVAFAVSLLMFAGLTVRTVMRLERVDLGFLPDNLVQTTPSMPHDWRVKEKYVPATTRIDEMLRGIPGVIATATRANNPIGSSRAPASLAPSGGEALSPASTPNSVLSVDSGYFSTLRIPIVKGRAFTAEDRETSMPVAIVNQRAATLWWRGSDPVGQQLRVDTLPGQGVLITIVGIARDNRAGRGGLLLASDAPELYRPIAQSPSAFPTFYARAASAPAALLRPIRVELGRYVLGRPVSANIVSQTVERQLGGVVTTSRQLLVFAGVGLALALVGVYGVLSYSVNRRRRELGIRRALGASSQGVYGLVLRDALMLTIPGVAFGVLGNFYASRLIAPLLYGTPTNDMATWAAIIAVVLVTTVVAALVPATRAARVAPLIALRS